jgi:hypothetical protein
MSSTDAVMRPRTLNSFRGVGAEKDIDASVRLSDQNRFRSSGLGWAESYDQCSAAGFDFLTTEKSSQSTEASPIWVSTEITVAYVHRCGGRSGICRSFTENRSKNRDYDPVSLRVVAATMPNR